MAATRTSFLEEGGVFICAPEDLSLYGETLRLTHTNKLLKSGKSLELAYIALLQ